MTEYDTCKCGRAKMTRSSTCRTCYTRWPDRFWRQVEKTETCWLWTGMTQFGYGVVNVNYKNQKAHRVAYEMLRGAIPEGLTLDHLCRVRRCVNPAHLESVTASVNVQRGSGPFLVNTRKTHCKRGHEFTPENTIIDKRHGGRSCRACMRIHDRTYRQNHPSAERVRRYRESHRFVR